MKFNYFSLNQLKDPLPLNRFNESHLKITYEDYFSSICSYLEKQGIDIISKIISKKIDTINITSEKHGAFYHPAKIHIETDGIFYSFVLNVAISKTGISILEREYSLIKKLNDKFILRFLPSVYDYGEVTITNQDKINMFLGEWLDDYYEFHISKNNELIVWDTLKGKFQLYKDAQLSLYCYVSKILTYYYDIETFERISPWSHAAGDFIVKYDAKNIDLKLISVRNYKPIIYFDSKDEYSNLTALLFFLIELSLYNRIDRIDGVGDIVWLEDIHVKATIEGFLEGLDLKAAAGLCNYTFINDFKEIIFLFTKEELYNFAQNLVENYNQKYIEIDVIKTNLKEHINILYENLYREFRLR